MAMPSIHRNSAGRLIGLPKLLGLMIVITEIVFLNYLGSTGIEVVLSSMAVTIALLIEIRFGLRENAPTPGDMIVFIFNWLFLDLAPKIQLISMPQALVNSSSVSATQVAIANLACALFIMVFTCVYWFLSRRPPSKPEPDRVGDIEGDRFSAGAVGLAVFFCVVVVGVAAPFAYRAQDEMVVSPLMLIVNRFLLFLPSATLLILLNETIRNYRGWTFSRICVVALLVLLVLITENPYTEKRNALGPVYIGLLLVGFQRWFSFRHRRLWLLVGAMVLIFPAITVFTHNHNQSLSDLSFSKFSDQIAEHYFSINYDSWANIYTSIEVVSTNGLQWGHQLLGSLLFFVPSSIWTTKPLATGIFLANFLIANYSMWFKNLSGPLIAEGYLDFGFVGVFVYGGALAYFINFLNKFALRSQMVAALPMATYAAVFMMIIMRGSLMIALGFAAAACLSFLFASALLSVRLGARARQSPRRRASVSLPAT